MIAVEIWLSSRQKPVAMKCSPRLFPLGLLVSFLTCYLEWGKMREFAFEMEFAVLADISESISAFANPLVFVPFACQLLLLVAAFQKVPNRGMILGATVLLLPFVLIVAFAGMAGGIWKMTLSTVPFLAIATLFIIKYRHFGKIPPGTV